MNKNINQRNSPREYWMAPIIMGAIGFILGIAVTRKKDVFANTLGNQSAKLKDLLHQRDARIAILYKHIADLERRLAEFERGRSRLSTTLSEDIYVRQIEGEPKRRWFSDTEFDLIVWFNKETSISNQKTSSVSTPQHQESRVVKRLHAIYGEKSYAEEPERIIGFQLCYDKTDTEKALTWLEETGYTHHLVDTGEEGAVSKRTPILTTDGKFESSTIAELFQQHGAEMDQQIAQFVYDKLIQYQPIRAI